ncbi:MAG: ABC transporter permease subunit [Myxococcales bacterium]|nr:ABC transporter permease subunit [Myxococcales bacterium]
MFLFVQVAAAAPAASADGERDAAHVVRVGSKKFTESVVLGELLVGLARAHDTPAAHQRELGGTRILWNALRADELDIYPEYTGTLARELLARPELQDPRELARALEPLGLRLSAPLGFNNTYALGLTRARARALDVRTISDLRDHAELRLGLTEEFYERKDGWPVVRAAYGLAFASDRLRTLDHDLAYAGLLAGELDVIDFYSTDPQIAAHGLTLLEDDRGVFPRYDAVLLYRADLERRAPAFTRALTSLEGQLDDGTMAALNGRVQRAREPEAAVAASFLDERLGLRVELRAPTVASRLRRRAVEHLTLVGVSLLAAVLVAIPLGVVAARRRRVGQVVLALVGVVQTIPSLALLVVLIPPLGIGAAPAIVALFLYSLLPIVRSTHAGLTTIDPRLREAAAALGLPARARLRLVELPMAAPSVLSGVKTSAVINVGTATLGALVGAGGFGQPILAGIRLADTSLILQGAIPAAALALLVQGLFELLERALVPRGLRLRSR